KGRWLGARTAAGASLAGPRAGGGPDLGAAGPHDIRHMRRRPAGYHGPGSFMTSVNEAFASVPFVRALGPAERDRLTPYARVKAVGTTEGCWSEGQSPEDFAFVVRGRIKLVKLGEHGRETILELANPGELLCGSAVF